MSALLPSLVLCVIVTSASPQTAAKPVAREQVDTTIGLAIQVLEAKDYRTFLLEFVPPDQVKVRGGSPDALNSWVQYFSAQATNVLEALKYARTETPTYAAAKTTATFALKEPNGPPSLKMVKIGKYWYLGNK